MDGATTEADVTPPGKGPGLECQHCHAIGQWSVTHRKDVPDAIRRRRVCDACGTPAYTFEISARDYHAIYRTTSKNPED